MSERAQFKRINCRPLLIRTRNHLLEIKEVSAAERLFYYLCSKMSRNISRRVRMCGVRYGTAFECEVSRKIVPLVCIGGGFRKWCESGFMFLWC